MVSGDCPSTDYTSHGPGHYWVVYSRWPRSTKMWQAMVSEYILTVFTHRTKKGRWKCQQQIIGSSSITHGVHWITMCHNWNLPQLISWNTPQITECCFVYSLQLWSLLCMLTKHNINLFNVDFVLNEWHMGTEKKKSIKLVQLVLQKNDLETL